MTKVKFTLDRQTDGQTDGQTDRVIPIYPPNFVCGGYKNGIKVTYCGWLKFHGVLIFVVFVGGSIHEFHYPWKGNFLYELWKKILWPQILNLTNVSFLFNPQKLVPTKIKPYIVILFCVSKDESIVRIFIPEIHVYIKWYMSTLTYLL